MKTQTKILLSLIAITIFSDVYSAAAEDPRCVEEAWDARCYHEDVPDVDNDLYSLSPDSRREEDFKDIWGAEGYEVEEYKYDPSALSLLTEESVMTPYWQKLKSMMPLCSEEYNKKKVKKACNRYRGDSNHRAWRKNVAAALYAGAKIAWLQKDWKHTFLTQAVLMDDCDFVQFLFDHGADGSHYEGIGGDYLPIHCVKSKKW